MNKLSIMLLFGSGVLLGFSKFFHFDEMVPVYIAAIILVVVPFAMFYSAHRQKVESEEKAEKILKEAQSLVFARKEVKSKIPKGRPRRESKAAFEGATKVGAARSMAMLIRKPRLRETIYEICDFADMVLETIRRMPKDTPAAVTFTEKHLSKLMEMLERCFEMSRSESYKNATPSVDSQEIECFSTFITAFKRQQDYILFEGLKAEG